MDKTDGKIIAFAKSKRIKKLAKQKIELGSKMVEGCIQKTKVEKYGYFLSFSKVFPPVGYLSDICRVSIWSLARPN